MLSEDVATTQYMEGAQLKYVKVRSGKLKLDLYSSIAENMTLYLQIPSASKNGQIINEVVKLAGAVGGVPNIVTREIDMNGVHH